MITLQYFPTAGRATAFGVPIDDAVQRALSCARELDAASEKAPEDEGFGERFTNALRNRLAFVARARGAVVSAESAPETEDESFGEKLTEAVEKRSGQKEHEAQAEREHSRYPQRRKRGASE